MKTQTGLVVVDLLPVHSEVRAVAVQSRTTPRARHSCRRLAPSVMASLDRAHSRPVRGVGVIDGALYAELARAGYEVVRPEPEDQGEMAGTARRRSANRNRGSRQCRATRALVPDNCCPKVDLGHAQLGQARKAPACDVLEGAIHPAGLRPNGNHVAPVNLQGGCLWSCNLMVRQAVFQRVCDFDEQFLFACMEDVDLREGLLAAGAQLVFAPNAVDFHPWRRISEREVTRQIISHAIHAEKHPAFVGGWTALHALRMAKGRLWLYAASGFGTIPRAKYRTVSHDLVAPFALLAVTRVAPLLCSVDRRFSNSPLQAARA